MAAPATPDALAARVAELEERLRALEEENDRLARANTESWLLGQLAEEVHRESEVDAVLRVGLERMSVLEDVPVCAACTHRGGELVATHAFLAFAEEPSARPGDLVLAPSPRVLAALSAPIVLSGAEECAEAGLGRGGLLAGFSPRAVLLVPVASDRPSGLVFVFADDASELRLIRASPVLQRAVELVAGRAENAALRAELRARGAAVEARVAAVGRDALRSGDRREVPELGTDGAVVADRPLGDASGRGEAVLVVDDEPLVRRAVGRVLAWRGYHVLEAGTGEEALAVVDARDGAVDLLLADLRPPGVAGVDLARAFLTRCPGRPVLFMSGDPGVSTDGIPLAGGAVLGKPIAPDDLARAVRAALDAVRRRRSRA